MPSKSRVSQINMNVQSGWTVFINVFDAECTGTLLAATRLIKPSARSHRGGGAGRGVRKIRGSRNLAEFSLSV
jgi:hypothetical protein